MKIADNTIGSLYQYVIAKLDKLFSPRETKAISNQLFMFLMNMDRAEVIMNASNRVTEAEILRFHGVIEKLKTHQPLQYITGETEFYGLTLTVSPAVLIPRPETEELVDWILASIASQDLSILDIGTGSGCIPLALKFKLPNSKIQGIDISNEALKIAACNAKNLNLDVQFTQVDILTQDIPIKAIDIIVSNPPYIGQSEKTLMHKNVLDFEPELALFVEDDDPLLFYRAIAQKSMYHLSQNGWLFFEINEKYANEVVHLLAEMGYSAIEVKKDMQEKDRMIKARKS